MAMIKGRTIGINFLLFLIKRKITSTDVIIKIVLTVILNTSLPKEEYKKFNTGRIIGRVK